MDENNQIQFTNLTLDSAFQKFYTVPDYQREYVWKEEQVEQLLADITEAFRANRSKDYFVYPNGKAFELVDGQQRMTTFFILLCVLKSFYQSNGIDTGIFEQCIHGTTVDDSGRPVSLYHLELQYEDTSSCLQTISKVKFPIRMLPEKIICCSRPQIRFISISYSNFHRSTMNSPLSRDMFLDGFALCR
jgi:uncharacterized protein with ParB-like and HNH nuclease domain